MRILFGLGQKLRIFLGVLKHTVEPGNGEYLGLDVCYFLLRLLFLLLLQFVHDFAKINIGILLNQLNLFPRNQLILLDNTVHHLSDLVRQEGK
jgi:hypothetical protein